uniref:Transmembrane 4 L six family member 19 n=1 Tax=Aotus nancymaae TaxID=37293 RepID=A0A2K5D5V1_AOTNA
MLSSLCTLACSRTCSQILGLSLGTAALFAAGANMALLFPNWDVTYLLRGLVGRHAMLGTGLWGGGLMVILTLECASESPGGLARAALLGSLPRLSGSGVGGAGGFACLRSSQVMGQLGQGPHFGDHCPRNYLYDRLLWSSVCLEPSKAVVWHVAFFSALLCISLLQLLLVVVHVINSFLGLFCSLCEK